jgi:ABC-2 type transport system permease protein
MLRASLYIALCSAKNSLLVRLRRLREPRYLIFAIAGAAYMYFAVFVRIGTARRTRRGGVAPPDIFAGSARTLAAAAGGIAMLAMAALAWVLPTRSTLFDFSESEIHLLFPAPVTRRALLFHRLVRSQFRIIFGALVLSFFVTNPGMIDAAGVGSNAARLLRLIAIWIFFVTVRVYFAGVTLARGRLASADARVRWTAWAPILAVAAAVAVVGVPVGRSLLSLPLESFNDLVTRIAEVTASGLPRMALWPFVSLLRPVFADGLGARLVELGGALIVLIATLAWVLHSDEVFYPLADDERPDAQPLAAGPAVAVRARPINWPLGPAGSTEGVFFWKNGMESLRSTKVTAMLPFLLPLIFLGVTAATAGMSLTGASGPAAGLSIAALAIAAVLTLVGPQAIRSDIRGDLRHLEQLKTWPVKAAAVIRGELSWPLTALTVCVWFALGCGAVFSAAAFPEVPIVTRLSFCSAAFLLAPALIVAQLTVHNAAAVLLPAWVQTGRQRSRGLDAIGQRLILFGGVMLGLIVVVGPGAIVGGFVGFVFYRWIGVVAAIPAAAVCFTVVALEVLLTTEALGGAYERIDLSAVEPAE